MPRIPGGAKGSFFFGPFLAVAAVATFVFLTFFGVARTGNLTPAFLNRDFT